MTAPDQPNPARAAPSSSLQPSARRVAGLDGVRAFAVVVVVIFHLFPGLLIGGFLGVDVFFVVSGFIITRLLLLERGRTGRIALGAFWQRRARRLLPALVVLLLVCSSLAALIGGDVLVGLGGQLIAAMTFSSNWYFMATGSDYFAHGNPELFRNLWSLAVEEQFYLLWPLIVLAVIVRLSRRMGIGLLAVVTAASAIAMGVLLVPGEMTAVYYGTGTHAFGLTLGALVAMLTQWWSERELEWSRGARSTLGVLGAAAGVGLAVLATTMPGEADWTYRGGLALVAVLTAVVICALLVPGSRFARALEWAPVRWIGVRSYGIYLWHWPLYVLAAAVLPTWTSSPSLSVALGASVVVVTIALAALSFRYIETPLRHAGFRATGRTWAAGWRRGSRAAIASATALVLVVAGVAGTAAAVVTQRETSDVEDYIRAGQDALAQTPTPTPAAGTQDREGGTAPAEAGTPAALQGDQITAIGDSVMLAAVTELQAALPGIAIDAAVSRQMSSAPEILQSLRDAGALRKVVIVSLGTNGSVSEATLEELRSIIGPQRELVVVTAQAPRGWIPGVNEKLASFAWQYRNVELADWHTAVQPHLGELARDQVHFGPVGARIYTAAIREALQRLAALPPLRDDAADESLPRVV
ncbi:acyltransferase family protein [Salinibacterium sp. ZJ70]|uniref:acyltransferase family protein n=1 Tax=Salinibacterium sp. ZJ70 TaxID=2708084 RepID=UPI001423DF9F|nr:acyltransferase family protein [Salinibacterium sp. ZJ70]